MLFCLFLLTVIPVQTIEKTRFNTTHPLDERRLENGDIILRYGKGLWSQFFRDVSRRDKRFSHAGIVVREEGAFYVIHAAAAELTGVGKVTCDPLGAFLEASSDYAVYRLAVSGPVRQKIAHNARNYLGVSFDTSFDLSEQERLYCTEMVMQAVNKATGFVVIRPTAASGIAVVAPDNCYEHRLVRSVIAGPGES
uniref:Permuted papain-like amidase YaeF/Yiix C92 family enzyme n=1 Tax=Chlorobium phaeobacteroides (strain BS1) TaxID=331678 RepID=B3EKF4_CHLPB